MDTSIDPINFDTANSGKFVSVPGNRLQKLPKFEPVEGMPIGNYIQVETLITEMLYLKAQFNLDEQSFVSFLLSQYNVESKSYIRSFSGTRGDLTALPLERILEITRTLFLT